MSAKVRHRHLLKKKDLAKLLDQLEQTFPLAVDPKKLETAVIEDQEVLLSNGEVFAFKQGDDYIPSLRAILTSPPKTKYVTVDMGAVKFVANGADIMSPGIIEADVSVNLNDLVWVRDEKYHRPLAIGQALMSGPDMVAADTGKAVKAIHYVGDKLWELHI